MHKRFHSVVSMSSKSVTRVWGEDITSLMDPRWSGTYPRLASPDNSTVADMAGRLRWHPLSSI